MLSKKILTQRYKTAEVENSNSTKQKHLQNDKCVNFTSDEYLQIGGTNNTFGLGTNPFTIIAWFKAKTQVGNWFQMGAYKASTDYWYINASSFIAASIWGFSFDSKAGNSNKERHSYATFGGVAAPVDATSENWNMLAISTNRADAASAVFNNTDFTSSLTSGFSSDNISPTDHTSSACYTKIGRYRVSGAGVATSSNTDIKSVAFFDKYMTAAELSQIYLEGYNVNYETGKHATNLKDWYRFGNRSQDRFPYISNRIALGDRPSPEVTNAHFRDATATSDGVVGWNFQNLLGGTPGITHDNTNKWISFDGTAYDRLMSDSIKAGPGEVYVISVSVSAGSGGTFIVYLGNNVVATPSANVGTYTYTATATTSDPKISIFVPPGSSAMSFSSFTCKFLDTNLIRPGFMVNGEASDIKRGTGKIVEGRFD
tara:strand:- start:9144 stop:10427 length:1284 start_codon:yes stop_codon:yes gene_type:complete